MFKIFGRCLTLSSIPSGHHLLCRFLENLCRICAESLLKKRKCLKIKHFQFTIVGVTGFEPATPWSQTRCATGLRYTPKASRFRNAGAKVCTLFQICKFCLLYFIRFCSTKIFLSTWTPFSTCSLVCVAMSANLTRVS